MSAKCTSIRYVLNLQIETLIDASQFAITDRAAQKASF